MEKCAIDECRFTTRDEYGVWWTGIVVMCQNTTHMKEGPCPGEYEMFRILDTRRLSGIS